MNRKGFQRQQLNENMRQKSNMVQKKPSKSWSKWKRGKQYSERIKPIVPMKV